MKKFILLLMILIFSVIVIADDDLSGDDDFFEDDTSSNSGFSDDGSIINDNDFNSYVGDNYPGLAGSNFEGGSFDSGTGMYTGADGSTLDLNQFKDRSEEHTSELQSHSFISYAVFCLKKKTK